MQTMSFHRRGPQPTGSKSAYRGQGSVTYFAVHRETAFVAQRRELPAALDYFLTPPWRRERCFGEPAMQRRLFDAFNNFSRRDNAVL